MPLYNFNATTAQTSSLIISNSPPADTSKLWFDTKSNILFCQYKNAWCSVNPVIFTSNEIKTLNVSPSYWYLGASSPLPIAQNYDLLIDRIAISFNSASRLSANRWEISLVECDPVRYITQGMWMVGNGSWQHISIDPGWATIGGSRLFYAEIISVGSPSWLDLQMNVSARIRLIF